ncbi:hypothetical protein B0H11DRAFT_2239086 [Mycena galericulata]|nr:hypothetical protein B0H11DRAFT_2239086 [Mycena galericulata]
MSNNLQHASRAFGITGVVLTATLLLSMAYAAWNTASRPHLNRTSFRLLVCALISNLIFAASFIPVFSGPSAGSSFMAFFGVSPHVLSVHLNNTEARTHRLVIVHCVNGKMMEKYYYIGSVVNGSSRSPPDPDLCVYSLRPILYALLAAGDPVPDSIIQLAPCFTSDNILFNWSLLRAIRAHGKTTHSTTGPTSISTVRYTARSSHSMRRFSMNNRAVLVQLEQGKQSTTWGTGGAGLFAEQSSGGKVFEERSAVSQSDAEAANGKPALVEQEQEPESTLSEALREREREQEEEELDVEAQTRSRAEDIMRQM